MLNRIQALREAAANHGCDVEEIQPITIDPSDENNDRELIGGFMRHMLGTQKLLFDMESTNKKMQDLANLQIYGKKDENNRQLLHDSKKKNLGDEVAGIIKNSKDNCTKI